MIQKDFDSNRTLISEEYQRNVYKVYHKYELYPAYKYEWRSEVF